MHQQADRSREAHELSPFKFQDKSEGHDECRPAQALGREQIPGPGRQGDGSQGMTSEHPRDSAFIYIYRRTGTSAQGTLFAAHAGLGGAGKPGRGGHAASQAGAHGGLTAAPLLPSQCPLSSSPLSSRLPPLASCSTSPVWYPRGTCPSASRGGKTGR